MKISVCIPCYKRPDLAKEALLSVLNQSLKPYEILIGDDSPDDETELMLKSLDTQGVRVHYWHNNPSLGQAKNVQFLFQKAEGELITLIHDDDRFRPEAFECLIEPLKSNPDVIASFGKQMIISEEGIEDISGSERLNQDYYRDSSAVGIVENTLEAGALGMFPNNAYLVRASIAKSIDYYDDDSAKDACDFYFGFRLALSSGVFYFCDQLVADYRLTEVSVARSGSNTAYYKFKILLEQLSPEQRTLRLQEELKKKVKIAIIQALDEDVTMAWKLYFSSWHYRSIFSLGGINRFIQMLKRSIGF